MRIVGVNGIATNGEGNIDLLLDVLADRGLEIVDARVPLRHWFSARWGGCPDGCLVAEQSQDGDIVVAHSFGSYRAWYAHRVRSYRAVVCVAPAMSHGARWRYPERVHCWHSRKDWVIGLGARLLLHPFGTAGTRGFNQPGVTNIEKSTSHSGYFRGELLIELANYVEALAGSELPQRR